MYVTLSGGYDGGLAGKVETSENHHGVWVTLCEGRIHARAWFTWEEAERVRAGIEREQQAVGHVTSPEPGKDAGAEGSGGL